MSNIIDCEHCWEPFDYEKGGFHCIYCNGLNCKDCAIVCEICSKTVCTFCTTKCFTCKKIYCAGCVSQADMKCLTCLGIRLEVA